MQDEQFAGSAGRPAAPKGVVAPAAATAFADGAPPPRAPKVDSVPSDQLWRAAILAARQAAMTAAELRRALDASSAAPEL